MNESVAGSRLAPSRSQRSRAAPSLQQRCAEMAQRLASLLQATVKSGPLAPAQQFLQVISAASAAETGDEHRQPFDRLVAALTLAPVEQDLFVLAGLADEHEGYSSVLRHLHPRGEARASAGLAAQLFCETPAERHMLRQVLEQGTATSAGVLSVATPEQPFFERTLLPARGLWPVVRGIDVWPSELGKAEQSSVEAGLAGWLECEDVRRAVHVLRGAGNALVLVTARTTEAALARGAVLAARAGKPSAVFDWSRDNADQLTARDALLSVHCIARGVLPVIAVGRSDGAPARTPALTHFPGVVLVCAAEGALAVAKNRPVLAVRVEPLKHAERVSAWRELLPELSAQAPLLATRYRLEPAHVLDVVKDLSEAANSEALQLARVADSVRIRSTRRLSAGVELIRARATWSDLVLAPEQLTRLREGIERLLQQGKVLDEWGVLARKRGARGVRMLFSGPSGTGKTLSAEVLASELGADLMLVDLSRVVSKWIGETEKNLAQVFDAAEESQSVLLFDEADGLFGKRTEVSDARDRYANLETAYLLTRLEAFEGLAVLSTNLRNNIDAAFTRRLEFIVDFPEPGALQREALWRVHLPPAVPVQDDIDFTEIASMYPLVGGAIRNAAVAAAFLAATDDRPLTREHIVLAIRREYHKAGKPFPGAPTGENRARSRYTCPR